MQRAYTVQTIRAAEAAAMAVLPEGTLMQRAAAGLAAAILRELRSGRGAYGARVLLAIGPGDNGGDALFAGVRLLSRGVAVRAWRTDSRVHHQGWSAFLAAGGREVTMSEALGLVAGADLVVDGVLGIGGRPGLTEGVAVFARACAQAAVTVVAVDLPSGLLADGCGSATGDQRDDLPASFTAALTVTFGGLKLCHVLQPARSRCGRIEVVDIGLGPTEPDLLAWEPRDVAAVWPFPDATSDKYSRGVVGLDVGSDEYTGAGLLVTLGAVHAGAGMVRFQGGSQRVADLVRQAVPSVVFSPGRVQARVLGSGWGRSGSDDSRRLRDALDSGTPAVIDADGLRLLPQGQLPDRVQLMGHAGEVAALLGVPRGEVADDPIGAVLRVSAARGCSVLLKGATQYVAAAGSNLVQVAVPGPAWTAQAGSGDVLAGICGTLLAAGLAPADAALAGASVQALAAAAHPGPHPPQSIGPHLANVVASLRLV